MTTKKCSPKWLHFFCGEMSERAGRGQNGEREEVKCPGEAVEATEKWFSLVG